MVSSIEVLASISIVPAPMFMHLHINVVIILLLVAYFTIHQPNSFLKGLVTFCLLIFYIKSKKQPT